MANEQNHQLQSTRRLYYEDAYIKEFRARVVAIHEATEFFKMVLDQTAFYPLGGGQPSDTGKMKGANGEAEIKEVRTENGRVSHIGEMKGSIVNDETVTCSIDWNRRYALMRNHTLAHLMAEAIRRATGASSEVVSSGLDLDKARLDIVIQSSLGPFVSEIERVANGIIKEDRPIEIKTLQRNEAEEYVARFHESLKTLPPQVQSVRIVEVKDWHACACGGTHVRSTREIGEAQIIRRMSKGKGIERIEFRAKTS